MASLYLHIPFCERKCVYCDFYSIENLSPKEKFLEALHGEIDLYRSHDPVEYTTIFLGGGTPSLLSSDEVKRILDHLQSAFRISKDAEITVETNPGTVDRAKLTAYRAAGVNRLSIGIQSFRANELEFLGRIHSADEARQCVADARTAGFDNLSVDLIFSLPGQTAEDWNETLSEALSLQPDHISAYSLIVEDNTPLARMVRSKLVSPNPLDEEAALYSFTMKTLREHGYEQYEVSNYAKPGFRSRHNYNYWCHENYLGFGPSAHSFWRSGGNGTRWWNIANLKNYIDRLALEVRPVASQENVSPAQLATERLFLGLRSDGVDISGIEEEFRLTLPQNHRQIISKLIHEKQATMENQTRLKLTPKGYLVCDEICERLMA